MSTKAERLRIELANGPYGEVSVSYDLKDFIIINENYDRLIKCDGNNQHYWKTYNSGFSEYQYCSVCDRKAQ